MRRLALVVVGLISCLLAANSRAAAGNDIFDAVRAGDGDKVKALLQADPKLAEARTEDGSTALHLAALEGHAEIARVLLAGGAQVNARGLRDETPLHMAMYDAHRELAEVLLASQADIGARNTEGETPLHLAARKGHRELVVLLLDHNADINARDRQDATPLHAAAAAGHKEVVEVLLSRYADMFALDKAGRTPKAVAAEKQESQIAELLTPRVGDFYNLQRVVFEGTNTFSDKALREALKSAWGFAEATHPLAPLDELLEAIQRKLLTGYQHEGFPEAQVAARHDAKAGRIVVKVVEGPRYLCGEVKVTGTQKAEVAGIIQPLTVSRPAALATQQPFEFKNQAPGLNPLRPPTDGSKPEDAPWLKGEGAPFSDIDARQMRTRVLDALHEQGFLMAKASVTVVPDKAARTAQLQVEVSAEGPRSVIERIDVAGNKTNSTEAVLRYLEIKPGMELSAKLIYGIQDRLWRAARFLTNSISLGSPDAEGRVALRIGLVEYEEAPPLGQEFSPIERGMLKLRDWLAKVDQGGDDFQVSIPGFPGKSPAVDAVLSPRLGLLILAKAAGAEGAGGDEYALAFKAGQAGFYAPISGHKLVLPAPKAQLTIVMACQSKVPDADKGPFDIQVAAGFKSIPDDTPTAPAYRFELALAPVVCIGFAHRWDCKTWFDGDLLIRSNATLLLKVNTGTGRLVEFRHTDKDEGFSAELRCQADAFKPALQHVEATTAGLADSADTNAPFSSAIAFLIEETLSSKYLGSQLRTNSTLGKASRLSLLVRKFPLERVLAPLNRLATGTNDPAKGPNGFMIPVDPDLIQPTAGGMMALVADYLLQKSDDLFAPRSWPWTLLRETCFTIQGKSRYREEAIKEVRDSAETGPLGCLVLAELLAQFQPPLAREAAARGLERLTAADLRRDCRLFLAGDSIISQCCQALATSLRDMDEAQLETLLKEQPPAIADFIRDCLQRLRAQKEQPVFEALAPALDAFWERGLKEQVAIALQAQAADPVKAFKDGVSAYQNSLLGKSEAAKLFVQAAEHGHSGAQYFLGMMYEKGEGVPKDITIALRYYTQSATNGYDEAAATLGHFYSDGIGVNQDYVEAYVWYGVAAARHHRMAGALRNGAQRKLTERELAAAKKRVAAILEAMPPESSNPSPSEAER
jgi:ankyrin repeat protein